MDWSPVNSQGDLGDLPSKGGCRKNGPMQEILVASALLAVGLVLLYYGADWLVDGASSMAVAAMVWFGSGGPGGILGPLFHGSVSAGLLVAFIGYLDRLFRPLRELSGKVDAVKIVKPGGNHGTRIRNLPPGLQKKALGALERWLEVENPR